jgi:hypothetical protein
LDHGHIRRGVGEPRGYVRCGEAYGYKNGSGLVCIAKYCSLDGSMGSEWLQKLQTVPQQEIAPRDTVSIAAIVLQNSLVGMATCRLNIKLHQDCH